MAAKTVDAVLVGAVELARAAAEEAAARPSDVGEHLGTVVEEERVVSHRFAAAAAGYRGWHWTVTLARVPRGRVATVSEVELLPGDDALLAAPWVPWEERLRPGDVGPGDVLPFRADDPRLQPGYTPTGDEDEAGLPIELLALERARVLGPQGRDEAAQRWHLGSRGPTSPIALASTSPCASCGFLVPLSGSLGQVFGVCTNEWSPDDGKVVSLDHGCGAHSETDAETPPSLWPAAPLPESPLEIVTTADSVEDVQPAAAVSEDLAPNEPSAQAPQDEPIEPEGDGPEEA